VRQAAFGTGVSSHLFTGRARKVHLLNNEANAIFVHAVLKGWARFNLRSCLEVNIKSYDPGDGASDLRKPVSATFVDVGFRARGDWRKGFKMC